MKPHFLVATLLCLAFSPAAEAGLLGKSVTATVDTGKLEGVKAQGLMRFLGIPYAAPPTGALRWRPPAPPAPWEGKRSATGFGASCPQAPIPADPTPLAVSPWVQVPEDRASTQSEDCLFLNVWAPLERGHTPRPVMVWIHGGGFVTGSAAYTDYDGSAFAREGVVFVSINYRLGRLGFFAHPALTAESPDGPLANYGMLDAIAALHWVQRNAAAFGGDPNNVTIFGQSSGAFMVDELMASPLAKGLFTKAIAQSAPAFLPLPAQHGGKASAEDTGKAWAASVGVTTNDAAALRALPAETVVGNPFTEKGPRLTPIIDGKIVTERVADAFAASHQAKIPYMVGANNYDGSVLRYFQMSSDEILDVFGKNKAKVMGLYTWRDNEPAAIATAAFGDHTFAVPARYLARKASGQGQPTYLYHFGFVQRELQGKVPGAAHGSELCVLFQTCEQHERPSYVPRTTDLRMGNALRAYWVNFATKGDPNGGDLVPWPAYTEATDQTMWLSNSGPLVMLYYQKERLDVLENASPLTPKEPKKSKVAKRP